MKMQVKDLVEVTLATMPVRIEHNNTLVIEVCHLFYNGECMIPKPVMEMEVECVSLYYGDDQDMGLLIEVR